MWKQSRQVPLLQKVYCRLALAWTVYCEEVFVVEVCMMVAF